LTDKAQLNFRDLKGSSKLFLDFLYYFEKVAPYYCADFRNTERFKINASNIAGNTYQRSELIDILGQQNKTFGLGPKTFENISRLADKRTCVVFTGQQVGLLTGPMYTIYKTLTSIKLAEYLSSELNIEVIPVFWMASDDHDFEEVRHVHPLNGLNNLRKIYYEPENMPNNIPLSFFDLDDNIGPFIDQVFSALPKSENIGELESLVRNAYKPGVSISEAFGNLLGRLFENSGLVVVNPSDVRIKRLAAPLFEKEITDFNASNQIIQLANIELGKLGYHTQVNRPDEYLNLFYFAGRRARIGFDGDSYFIDGVDRRYSLEELLESVKQAPNYFSPNVLLRPVMQDYIFPTLAYIGGPSEVAYFAQIKDLHNHFGVQCPIVFPRISATILDKYACKIMEKYDLKLSDLVDDKTVQAKIKELVEKQVPEDLANKLENDRDEIIKRILEIENYLAGLDEGVKKTVQKSKGKVEYELKSLREKIFKAYKKQNDTLVDSVERTANFLFPESSLQERHLNVLTFLNKYGLDFIDCISEHLKLDAYDHQVLYLEEMGY
jgi:bacillithiol biosynthesis cysteine-adding enzyme BshC